MFLGFVPLEGTLVVLHQEVGGDLTPADAAATPTARVYGPSGLLPDAAATVTLADAAAVAGVTLGVANLVRVNAVAHGFVTGQRVTVAGVGGIAAANGTFVVTAIDADHFDLVGTAGSGSYTSGGAAHSTGLYAVSLPCQAVAGFDAGENYDLRVQAVVASEPYTDTHRFGVT